LQYVLPSGVVSSSPLVYPDPSESAGYPMDDATYSRRLMPGDFMLTAGISLDFRDPPLYAALTYSKDRTLINTGPLQIIVTFYSIKTLQDSQTYYQEPIATTPALSIDRPGTADRVCCYELSPVSGDASVWTTTYESS
jgi:hypothetical protein